MAKFTVLLLVAVFAVALKRSDAKAKEETNNKIQQTMAPVVEVCSKEHGITKPMTVSHKNPDLDSADPCFIKCLYQKIGSISDKNTYNKDQLTEFVKKMLPGEGNAAKIEEVQDTCVPASDIDKVYSKCEDWKTLLWCQFEAKDKVEL